MFVGVVVGWGDVDDLVKRTRIGPLPTEIRYPMVDVYLSEAAVGVVSKVS